MRAMNWGVGRLAALVVLTVALGVSTPGAAAATTARITRVGNASAGTRLSLVLPLKTDKAGLARFATAVSTPGSPQYGQFQSIPTLVHRFGAPAIERADVLRYLRGTGATGVKIDGTGLYADATMSVGLARKLFGAEEASFRTANASTARFLAPTTSVRIPPRLAGAVTGVVGLDTQPLDSGQSETPLPAPLLAAAGLTAAANAGSAYQPRGGAAAGCAGGLASGGFTPNQYRTAYGFDPLYTAGFDGTGERVALIEINGFKSSDVRAFATCFGLPVPKIRQYEVGGVKKPLPAVDGETTLDLEILDAAAPGLKGIDVYESHPLASDVLHALTVPLENPGRKPDVISASLGSCESQARQAIGAQNITTVESALELAAASGISVLASSGDDGSSSCFDLQGLPKPRQAVSFPASSPWVTGVGGTNIAVDASNNLTNQVVWDSQSGAGGGGFSMLFRRPAYQDGFTAARHRVVPDVSMLADTSPGYAVFCTARGDCQEAPPSGPWGEFGGTSAGTPLLAGGLAVVDEALRKNGRQDIGLANPLFYKIATTPLGPQTFRDVVSGDNDVFALASNGTHNVGCCTAAPGFDAASGLGGVILSELSIAANGIVDKLVAVGVALPRQRHPVSDEHLLARVSCSGRCLMGAYAKIRVGRSRKPLTQYSNVYLLRRRNSRTIRIGLDAPTLRVLRSALSRHQAIIATVYGAVLDPSGDIERRSPGRTLHITS